MKVAILAVSVKTKRGNQPLPEGSWKILTRVGPAIGLIELVVSGVKVFHRVDGSIRFLLFPEMRTVLEVQQRQRAGRSVLL